MIETKELTYAYVLNGEDGKSTVALRGVDIAIEKGTFTVVLGHNGSGKSTLAKTFNAVLLPLGGNVFVEGMVLSFKAFKSFTVKRALHTLYNVYKSSSARVNNACLFKNRKKLWGMDKGFLSRFNKRIEKFAWCLCAYLRRLLSCLAHYR